MPTNIKKKNKVGQCRESLWIPGWWINGTLSVEEIYREKLIAKKHSQPPPRWFPEIDTPSGGARGGVLKFQEFYVYFTAALCTQQSDVITGS